MRHNKLDLVIPLFLAIAVVGWSMNAVKLIGSDLTPGEVSGIEMLRVIGLVLTPIGVVMGFL